MKIWPLMPAASGVHSQAIRFATAILPIASRTSRQAVPRWGRRVTFSIPIRASGTFGSNS